MLLTAIHIANSNKLYLVLHVKCLIYLLHCNRIWISPTDIYKTPQYQIARISVHWVLHRYMLTDGQMYSLTKN